MNQPDLIPWHNEAASKWISETVCWSKMAKLVQGTLQMEPNKFPHQIRAAAAVVIMIGRKGMWPESNDLLSVVDIIALARRKLTQVKQLYSVQSRQNPSLSGDKTYKAILQTIGDEIKILEARIADPPLELSDQPPDSWADFWSVEF